MFDRDATDPKNYIQSVDKSLAFDSSRIVDYVQGKLDGQ